MFNEYFTASVDGGRSFMRATKVSSHASSRLPKENWPLNATIDTPTLMRNGTISTAFMSFIGRFPDGGDYMGLTADRENVFHPFWTDARAGSSQVWTASVIVEGREAHGNFPKNPSAIRQTVVNQLVQLVIDPANYDPTKNTAEVPVRLRNTSDEPIYPPLTVEIVADTEATSSEESLAEILNSANGKSRAGALFDYSDALGDFHVLGPHAVSEAVTWRVRVPKASKTYFDFDVNIRGSRSVAARNPKQN